MKHIEELIEELDKLSQMLAGPENAKPEDGRLEMRAADMIRQLKTALEDANGLCRSAMMIAERNGEANWPTFTARLGESLIRQHAVMYGNEEAALLAGYVKMHPDAEWPHPGQNAKAMASPPLTPTDTDHE
jgi:hypothetical protein